MHSFVLVFCCTDITSIDLNTVSDLCKKIKITMCSSVSLSCCKNQIVKKAGELLNIWVVDDESITRWKSKKRAHPAEAGGMQNCGKAETICSFFVVEVVESVRSG